jgi:hypothetical protein
MEFEIILLSERSQVQKDKYHMVSPIHEIQTEYMCVCVCNKGKCGTVWRDNGRGGERMREDE